MAGERRKEDIETYFRSNLPNLCVVYGLVSSKPGIVKYQKHSLAFLVFPSSSSSSRYCRDVHDKHNHVYLFNYRPEMESDDESLESAITLESDPDFSLSLRPSYSCHVASFTEFCHLLVVAVLWI